MNAMTRDRLVRLALVLVTSLGTVACGSGGITKVPVEGTVTFKGQPLATGQIQFLPESGPSDTDPAATGLVDNGKFTLGTEGPGDGAKPGKYRVTVFSYEPVQLRGGEQGSKSAIPARYGNPDTSGLTQEVPPDGKSDIKIDLEAK